MRVLVTGADGFIARNLVTCLRECDDFEVSTLVRNDSESSLRDKVADADAVVHLAGENRPSSVEKFTEGNSGLTFRLCSVIRELDRSILLILSSSVQAALENPYGQSKLASEAYVEALAQESDNPVVIYRLPGVFGKWCKPNYNSVVATFCNNIANDLPIQINDSSALLELVYVDDVVSSFIEVLRRENLRGASRVSIEPTYSTTLSALAQQISAFKYCRTTLISEPVGTGFARALYATYVSYLPQDQFAYSIPVHEDERGVFVEMLKTKDSGQFSYFTAHPGITRGGHYHHSKTEKFLVIKGNAHFGFRNILTDTTFSIKTSGHDPRIVETIPGWAHDITNIGDDEMIVMLWANEIFDRDQPDTITSEV